MEEEDFPYPKPFFLQTANNTNPKQQKQPKPSFSKCNHNPSSSITQKKSTPTPLQTSNSLNKSSIILPQKFLNFNRAQIA
jgi:hypothetical protein